MRSVTLTLDALPVLREAIGARCDLAAAAKLAELAGVGAVRVGVCEELRPVKPRDVMLLRESAPALELRMAPTQGLLKLALEARPDLVVLAAEAWEGSGTASPIDPRARANTLAPILRSLEEAGLPKALLVAPDLEAVKASQALGVGAVELFTGATVDLPSSERRAELERLGDAARLAAKLRLSVGVGGGLDYRSLGEVVAAVPVAERIVVGRAVVSRAMLVGLDRAARDFLALTG